MNASVRWATHFVDALECVKCRSQQNLGLYFFNGKRVDASTMTIDALKWSIDRMDVWCDQCTPSVNTRVAGIGRRLRKDEAAHVADIQSHLSMASMYDTYVLTIGKPLSKQELLTKVRHRPCAICGIQYPAPIMLFHTVNGPKKANVPSMLHGSFTIHDMIEEIERSTLLCSNCHKMVQHHYLEEPKETIALNENFWSSLN